MFLLTCKVAPEPVQAFAAQTAIARAQQRETVNNVEPLNSQEELVLAFVDQE